MLRPSFYLYQGRFLRSLQALRNLVRHSVIAVAITESEVFNASRDPVSFEKDTLLGPWFRLSPLQRDATLSFFSSPKTRDQAYILNAQRSVRMVQQLISSDLLDVVNHLVRASPEARNRVLDWFATALNINHKIRAMQVDPNTVASDGFMFNLTTCLDQLCQPFMDANFTKVIFLLYLHGIYLANRAFRSIESTSGTYTAILVLTSRARLRSMLINMLLMRSMLKSRKAHLTSLPRSSSSPWPPIIMEVSH
jgi:hypothetical protein